MRNTQNLNSEENRHRAAIYRCTAKHSKKLSNSIFKVSSNFAFSPILGISLGSTIIPDCKTFWIAR